MCCRRAFSAGLITGPLDIVVIKTLALDKILRFENGPLREGSLNERLLIWSIGRTGADGPECKKGVVDALVGEI